MNAKVRVLFAIGSMAGGGSERQIIGILKHVDRTRFEPLLYLIHRDGELLPEIPEDVPVFVFSERVSAAGWNYPGRINGKQLRDLASVMREQHVDVVYDRTFQMTLVTAPAARRCSVPRISVAVADPKIDLEQNAKQFIGIKRRRLRRGYLTANRVAAVSEGVREALIAYHQLPPELVVTVRNFLDIERIERLANEPVPKFDPDRFHVVCAGRLHPQKGYGDLLSALDWAVNNQGHQQILLHIFGQGELQSELEQFVETKRLGDHVRFEGFHVNPLPCIKQAQLFCLPSHYEGMPNSLVEAMALCVPVLATDCPSGPREVLAAGRYGRLVPVGDVTALGKNLEEAVLHYDEWKSGVPEARAFIEETFSPKAGIERIETLIQQVALESPRC